VVSDGNSDLERGDPSGSGGGGAADPRRLLATIYVALAAGVVGIVLVFLLIGPAAGQTVDRSIFRWIWLAAAVVCTLGAGAVRTRAGAVSPDARSVVPAAVVAWSLAEAQALLAGIGYFLTGDLPILTVGLLLFVFLMARHRPAVFLARP
jgi:hypothetical protein